MKLLHMLVPEIFFEYKKHLSRMAIIKKNKSLPRKEYEKVLAEQYYSRTGKTMDFSNPISMTQKQQWLKLYDCSEDKRYLSDKYQVRKYVEDVIGKDFLIPLLQIDGKERFFDANEIDFDKLPKQFVLKCSHGSGYVIIIKDKNKLSNNDVRNIKRKLNWWLSEDFAYLSFEFVYAFDKPCIIIEQYVSIKDDLPDYKFMCFSGKPVYVWCDENRFSGHRRTVFDLSYGIQPFRMHTFPDVKNKTKPDNFNKMIEIAKKLCGEYSYVRVDLYNVDGRIYFGELTFSSSSGYEQPTPDKYDKLLGDLIVIHREIRDASKEYRNE